MQQFFSSVYIFAVCETMIVLIEENSFFRVYQEEMCLRIYPFNKSSIESLSPTSCLRGAFISYLLYEARNEVYTELIIN